MLKTARLDRDEEGGGTHPLIVLDGEYALDGAIAAAVRRFQENFDLEPDGNFGPRTRAVFKQVYDIDIAALYAEMFTAETVAALAPAE